MKWAMVIVVMLASSASAEQLNVLLVVADDLRVDPHIRMPNLDRLAARGMRFERAYCQYPVCNPSRTSFLTGLRPDATGVLSNNLNFRKDLPDVVTLPQLFRQNGYFTVSLGKVFHRGLTMEDQKPEMDDPKSWTLAKYFSSTATGLKGEGRNLTGGKMPWCRWLAAEGNDDDQPDGQIAREAIALIEQHREQPFFIAVGFHKPHDPFIAPKRYFDGYPLDSLTLPQPSAAAEEPQAILGDWKNVFASFTDQERREFKRAYYAGASFMDAQLGKVTDALDRLGLTSRTIVVFLGDHGFHLGERGWWNKNTLFELSCRAPLVIAAPSAKAGAASPRTVEFVDIYPTLIDLCALPAPHELHGTTLHPLLKDPTAAWDRPAMTQVQRGKVAGRTVRTERWRYTEWDEGRAGAELYDEQNDPDEQRNLAADPASAEIIASLKPHLAVGRKRH